MSRALVVKVTCGAEDPERCNQAFTVAASAVASGADVSLWLTGEAAWFGLGPGVPLLVNTRVSSDRRGPIRVVETRYAADRARLLYELGEAPAAG